ncbi:hypothetical protein G1E_32235 [Pseudomonas sp. TJI-51]|uniref:hypothetical protein n=1 Tax=Pseudomonas sp. (strain TJI-51) TaxID=985010 RepID=UPI0001FD766F|nr:hypothetical protein [Pseudomonas sp. TJI-51]EGD06473.1 hypothetical protein B1M_01252 [Burkholderia sp. TJI49]KLJ14546.1 hypothetical protein G1E_32235 [Pseudomonas sp. TJI-51]
MKKLFLLFLAKKAILFALLFTPVFASAAAYSPAKVSGAVSGVLQEKMVSRGFAANDPRFGATVAASGNVIAASAAASAAAIVVGTVTAPAWATAAIAAGVGVIVGYAVNLAIDGITSWLFGEDSSQVNVVTAEGGGSVGGPLYVGGPFFSTPYAYATTPEGAAYASFADGVTVSSIDCPAGPYSNGQTVICHTVSNASWLPPNWESDMNVVFQESGSPYGSSTGVYKSGVGMYPAPPSDSPSGQTGVLPIQTAVDQISDTEKAKQLNPELVAALANRAWQEASQMPGYDGLPYQYSDPITASDAARWQSANPGAWPSVGDFVSPFPSGSPGTSPSSPPFSLPAPGEAVTPTNPSTQPQINLGSDPGIGAPTLEATPTGAQILEPLTRLFPDLRNFQVPAHQAECPRPTFDLAVIGKQVQMEAHCTISEDVRGPLYNASLLAWVLAALFIVLSA